MGMNACLHLVFLIFQKRHASKLFALGSPPLPTNSEKWQFSRIPYKGCGLGNHTKTLERCNSLPLDRELLLRSRCGDGEDVQRYPKSIFDLYRNETLTLTMKWQWIYNIHLGYPCADGWCYDPFSRGGRSAYNHLWTIKPLIWYPGLKPNDHPKSHSPP